MFASRIRSAFALILVVIAASHVKAQVNWSPTAAGTFSWNTSSNWSATFPNAAGANANLDVALAGSQTINLNVAITVGQLKFGANNTTGFAMAINAGTAGSLTFDNSGAGATLQYDSGTAAGTYSIGANITLNDNLTISNVRAGFGNLTIGGNIGITGTTAKNLIVNSARPVTITGNISTGAGAFSQTGTGTTVLSGTNNYTGITTISAGILQFGKEVSLYSNSPASWTATNIVVSSGATAAFNVGGTGQFTSTDLDSLIALGTGSGGFESGSFIGIDTTGGAFSYGTAIANPNGTTNVLGLTKLGTNTLTLTGANTYTGTTTISAGTLSLSGGDNRLLTTDTVAFSAASTLNVNAINQTLATLNVTTGVTATVSATGTGTLTLNGATNFTLTPSSGATTKLDLTALSSFTYNASGNSISLPQVASLASSPTTSLLLSKTSNTITASAISLLTSSVTISAQQLGRIELGAINLIDVNTISMGNSGSGTSAAPVFFGFATGLTTPTATFRGTAGGTTRMTAFSVQSGSGSSTGTGGWCTADFSAGSIDMRVTTLSVGAIGFTADSTDTYVANFIFSAGTVDATTLSIGTSSNTTTGDGLAKVSGTFTQNGGSVLATTLTLGTNALATNGVVTATYALLGGTLSAQTIQNGTNTGSSTRSISWSGGTIQNYNSTTDLSIAALVPITLLTSATHTFDAGLSRTITVNSVISGASGTGGLTKTDSGTLTLTGANTFTGNTLVSGGTLNLSNALALQNSTLDTSGAGAVTLASVTTPTFGGLTGSNALASVITTGYSTVTGVTLNLGASVSQSYSGSIADGAAGMTLTKSGSGMQTLSGTNTYSGGTTVSAGTLNIAGTGSVLGTAAVTGGVLRGTGTVGGAVTVNGGATVKAGTVDGIPGTFTLGGVSTSSGAILAVELNDPSPTTGSNGGSSTGSPNPTNNSFFNLGSSAGNLDNGTNIAVLVDVNAYTSGVAYSYKIATTTTGNGMLIGGMAGGSIINSTQFTFTDSGSNNISADFTSVSLTTDSNGENLYLNFTAAVPEPTALVGLAAFALLALRRKRSA